MAQGQSTKIIEIIKRSLLIRREFIDNLLDRIHFTIKMIWWAGLAPWVVELEGIRTLLLELVGVPCDLRRPTLDSGFG